MVVIGLVMAARFTGSLQRLELLALDSFLQLRPAEAKDDRIVLVSIDEADMRKTGYPIRDRDLLDLLNTLQTYKPAVIGLHILQNQIAETNKTALFAALKQPERLIVAEKILPASDQIPPPGGFSAAQVGLIDIVPDGDNHLRRLLLGVYNPIDTSKYRFSLTIRLVETYLVSQNQSFALKNGTRDPEAMRFGATELPRLLPNSGAYIGADTNGPQMLLNFRSGHRPFRVLSLSDIKTGRFNPIWLRDRIVIVGITDPKIRPIIPTAANDSTNSLDLQAHAVSQIISAVLDGRSLFNTWDDGWEYLWIMGWGLTAIVLGRSTHTPRNKLIGIGMAQVGLIGISYWLLAGGWWIPVIPASLVWLLNGIGCAAFYKYDWVLRSRLKENQRVIEERQGMIEQTFDVIHNGPLQTLASLLRQIRDGKLSQEQLLLALENLNREIRGIGEHLKQETLSQEDSLYLRDGLKVDLKLPMHELFFEVYSNTLERSDFPRFETLKIACYFEPIEQRFLSVEHKRSLCRFLEEALCNVGKHAEGSTHLNVTGTQAKDWYSLEVKDNGIGIRSSADGEGTKHARNLAARLGGRFQREPSSPKGTLCKLTFPLIKPWFR
ncbi:histidine kinase [Stenomitos frigidus ULC18]|uniref:Histidine kinase n=2 Tax=Stenomitos TaxID=1844270 RepID=A0A2T1E631_9CYAN|nr:histidine kinase [Stenomitos frigidus ULC18]